MDFWLIAAVAAGLALLAGAGFLGYFALATRRIAAEAERLVLPLGQVRHGRPEPHPLRREGRGAADPVHSRTGRPPAPLPPPAVRGLRARLPADRARPAGLGLLGARRRRHRQAARAGFGDFRLHRGARAREAAAGRAFAGRGRSRWPRRSIIRSLCRASCCCRRSPTSRRRSGRSSRACTSARRSSDGSWRTRWRCRNRSSWRRGRLPSCSGRRSCLPTTPSQAAAWPG